MNIRKYQGIIKHQDRIIYDFQTTDSQIGMAKIIRLINDEYPHTKGELIEIETGNVVYECRQRAIC